MLNIKLKMKILERFGTQSDAARRFNMHEGRLSQIIRGRRTATGEEKSIICSELEAAEVDLFDEERGTV